MFGRPNITGCAGIGEQTPAVLWTENVSGCFYTLRENNLPGIHDATDNDNAPIRFAASKSNATYGKSATVQPASVRMLHCIKF